MWAKRGSYRRGILAVSLLAAALAQPAIAGNPARPRFRIEAGTLASAIRQISQATGAEIVSIEPGLAVQPVSACELGPNAGAALMALLRNTPFRAVRLGRNSFRIERRRAPARPRQHPLHVAANTAAAGHEIVVEAKFPTRLADYPGSANQIQIVSSDASSARSTSLERALGRMPIVTMTAFGEGRDKIFIRGIADSSFNGASQPATSVYFGDALIGFGSPNPNLRLYDISAVEILEGPQGTLYGSGSVGGVIRIIPNRADPSRIAGSLALGGVATAHGSAGYTASGMVNLPLAADRAALRLVGYDEHRGGYIDDPRLGKDINGVDVAGGRLALALNLGGDVKIDVNGVIQRTRARDAQYADGSGPLARSAAFAEPYSSNLALASITLRKRWASGLELNSVVSAGRRTAFDRFDASSVRPAAAYDTERSSTMVSSETRFSGTSATGLNWVAGLALDYVEDGRSRAFGTPDSTNPLDEVTNITTSGSGFVQGRMDILRNFELTAGVRFTMARTDSRPARNGSASFIKGKLARRFDPTIALLWRASNALALYGRFQTGYRNGGTTVARGVGKVSEFASDSIMLGEVGLRYNDWQQPGFSASTALSLASWHNVLAELTTARGVPVTSNIGNARILTLEGKAEWTGRSGWFAGSSFLYTANRLTGDLAMQSAPRNRLLAGVPRFSAAARTGFSGKSRRMQAEWSIFASTEYVGRSVLGPGSLLDLDQGNYTLVDLGGTIRRGPWSLALSLDNLLDSQANRFALGNPVVLVQRDGYVPVRPRTATVTLGFAW